MVHEWAGYPIDRPPEISAVACPILRGPSDLLGPATCHRFTTLRAGEGNGEEFRYS